MPSIKQLRDRLLKKLKELFQLDQPELDFGFYRVMRAKAKQVKEFLEKDLPRIVKDSFGVESSEDWRELLEREREKFIGMMGRDALDADGNPSKLFEDTPIGEKYLQEVRKIQSMRNDASGEADVYDHLYRFFERYYDNGDFISRRYHARETAGRAAPFAIPYSGEEVKLHWANSDQYYIKTTEHFSSFTFDISQAKEVVDAPTREQMDFISDKGSPLKVQFRVADADEGEHGNIKSADSGKRVFTIHLKNPVAVNKNGELVANFEYKALKGYPIDTDEEDRLKNEYKIKNKKDYPLLWMADQIISATEKIPALKNYLPLLKLPAPTETIKKRPLLAKYIRRYTARNTMDYFIHKDLGTFLRRELDFYIKNEIMRLDDIENADAPDVERYLDKIKVLRKIGGKLIDFLAQLENFQKKLWLKKKFVVETNYCVTLDRVPEELYPQISENEAQIEEWIKLFAIDEITPREPDLIDPGAPGFANPPSVEFLKNNDKLLLDTHFFDEKFKNRLIASINDLDEQCDGLLIHSENFQALNLLQERYRKQVKCIYIDPPYNTASTPILYKNEYRHSSWISLIWDRVNISKSLMERHGVKSVAIDDTEMVNLSNILNEIFPEHRLSKIAVVHNPKGSITKDFNRVHEYVLFLTKEEDKESIARTLEGNKTPRKMRRWGENSLRTERRLSFYPIYVKDGAVARIGEVPADDFHPVGRNFNLDSGEIEIWPIDQDGVERRWNFGLDSINDNIKRITIQKIDNTFDLFLTHELTVPKTVWNGGEFDAGNYGNTLLINILGSKQFDFPKSINLVKRCIYLVTSSNKNSNILDYFAGSGTTGHAVINLNREDGGRRKYILVEMGDYFDTVLKPRIAKVVYSDGWKNGKPTNRDGGISHCFKYIRLESYEDALNNLRFEENIARDEAISGSAELREDYTLRYMLDVETRGGQSSLNLEAFSDPERYILKVKKPGSEEIEERRVDLIETFNYLIGLRASHIGEPQTFSASFKRDPDPELPQDQQTKLTLDGELREDPQGAWTFRKVEGRLPKDPANPDNGATEKALIIWRNLTGDLEKDNLALDEWLKLNRLGSDDFDVVYVNGSNNLPDYREEGVVWNVRLIEEEFMKLMWDAEGI